MTRFLFGISLQILLPFRFEIEKELFSYQFVSVMINKDAKVEAQIKG